MNNQNLKKLIVGFLVLSAITTSSSLLFLPTPSTPPQATRKDVAQTTIPQNAFVEPLPEDSASGPTINIPSTRLASSNLTDNLTAHLAQEIVKVNPNGPQAIDGAAGIMMPSMGPIADKFTEVAAVQLKKIPDWDLEAEKAPLIMAKEGGQNGVSTYIASMSDVAAKLVGRVSVNGNSSAPAITAHVEDAHVAFERAIRDTNKIPVPSSLLSLHKSFVKLLVYQKNALGLVSQSTDDPLQSSLILSAQEVKYNGAITAFATELQKQNEIHAFAPQSRNTNPIIAFAQDLIGIKTAHAFFFSIVFDPTLLAKSIWEFAQKLITEFVKDQLVHRIVNEVIKWVQGGGKPQFITNWKGFLRDAGNNAIDRTISKIAPQLCSSFGPLIELHFQRVNTDDEGPASCTLNQVISNVQDFADDFRNGSWLAYSESLKPANNVFGALIETHDVVIGEAAKEQEAKRQDAAANQGFTPTRICAKSDPSGFEDALSQRGGDKPQGVIDPRFNPPNGTFSGPVYCESWTTTSPGGIAASQIQKSIGAPLDRIVNAQDFTNLISAVINSGLMKLINKGVQGLSGLGGGQGSLSEPPTSPNALCAGLTGAELQSCLGQGGGTAQLGSDLEQSATSFRDAWQAYADANTEWISTADQITPILQGLTNTCTASAGQAGANIAFITTKRTFIVGEQADANTMIGRIQSFISTVAGTTTAQALAALASQLNQFDPQQLQNKPEQLDTLLASIRTLRGQVLGSSCPAFLALLQ